MRRFVLSMLALLVVAVPAGAQTTISSRAADITLGGRLHGQYETSSVDGVGSTFFLRRARLNADARIGEGWDARVQVDFAGGGAAVQDAWIRYAVAPGFRVSFGQFHRQFDLFEQESSTNLSIIERDGGIPGVSTCAGVSGMCTYGRFVSKLNYGGRDQGVRVEVGSGRVTFEGTVTNGEGINTSDANGGKSVQGRLGFAANDRLSVGFGLSLHDYDQAGETEYGNAWTADLEWGDYREGAHLQAAVVGGENWKVASAPTFLAWQVVGSWYAPIEGGRLAAVEPLLRLSSGDPDTDMDDDGGLLVTPGLMFYVSGRNKFGVNLDWWSPQTGDSEYSLKFQTYVYF